jgi:glycosyl transferase family 25
VTELFFDYFRDVYVINLPTRKDRLKQVRQALSAINAPDPTIFPAIRPEEKAGFPSIGAHGCFLSHLAVLADANSRRLERVLILEDDVTFSTDFSDRSAEVTTWLRKRPWDIFYGGGDSTTAEIPPEKPIVTAHFMGFNETLLKDLVAYLKAILSRPPGHPLGGPMHVDGAYSHFRADYPEVVTLAARPPLCRQRSSASDIHTRWFDRVPGLAFLAGAARPFLSTK